MRGRDWQIKTLHLRRSPLKADQSNGSLNIDSLFNTSTIEMLSKLGMKAVVLGVLKLSGFLNGKFFTRASSRAPRCFLSKKGSTYWDGATTRTRVGALVKICLSRSSQNLLTDFFSSQILSNTMKTFFPDRSCLKKLAWRIFPSFRAPNSRSSGSNEDHSEKLRDRCNGSVPYSIDSLK